MQPAGWAPGFSQSERAASEPELAMHMPTAQQRSLLPQPTFVAIDCRLATVNTAPKFTATCVLPCLMQEVAREPAERLCVARLESFHLHSPTVLRQSSFANAAGDFTAAIFAATASFALAALAAALAAARATAAFARASIRVRLDSRGRRSWRSKLERNGRRGPATELTIEASENRRRRERRSRRQRQRGQGWRSERNQRGREWCVTPAWSRKGGEGAPLNCMGRIAIIKPGTLNG